MLGCVSRIMLCIFGERVATGFLQQHRQTGSGTKWCIKKKNITPAPFFHATGGRSTLHSHQGFSPSLKPRPLYLTNTTSSCCYKYPALAEKWTIFSHTVAAQHHQCECMIKQEPEPKHLDLLVLDWQLAEKEQFQFSVKTSGTLYKDQRESCARM